MSLEHKDVILELVWFGAMLFLIGKGLWDFDCKRASMYVAAVGFLSFTAGAVTFFAYLLPALWRIL